MKFISLEEQRIFFPPPQWQVEGLLPARQHTILFGGKGSMKTFMALDLAEATATGLPTIFGPAPTQPGVSIYLSYVGEGMDGIRHQRTLAWDIAHQRAQPHSNFILLPGPTLFNMDEDAYIQQIIDGLDGEACRQVTIDTIFQATAGWLLVESGAPYMRFVNKLLARLECAVLSLHHPPKDNKTREQRGKGEKPTPYGAQDLTANTASMLYAERTGPATTSLEVLYHKDTPEELEPYYFQIEPVREAESLVLKRLLPAQHRQALTMESLIKPDVVWAVLNTFGIKVSTETLADKLTPPGLNREGRLAQTFASLVRARRPGKALEYFGVEEGWWQLPTR